MDLDLFQFDYPKDLIATSAVEPRDHSRLMLPWSRNHRHSSLFHQLPDFLAGDEIFVFNDTKVMPCRLFAYRKSGGRVEIFLLKPLGNHQNWRCLVKPARRINEGEELSLEDDPTIKIRLFRCESDWEVQFGCPPESILDVVNRYGHVPLPPYMNREDQREDRLNYQTVYAKNLGAVAAPTAGLHFTPDLLDAIQKKGCQIKFITLHVGLGTFLPVQAQDIRDHQMHSEYYSMADQTLQDIDQGQRDGREVICVGTTSLRAVESAFVHGPEGATTAFFHPENPPTRIRSLITNFHQPGSSLFMLVSSLLGVSEARGIYEEAFKEKYRLFSYGDGMWIRILN